MSRYMYSPSVRNMSIYSHRKEFETPTDELNFTKDYNNKINPIKTFANRFFNDRNRKNFLNI